MNLRYSNFIIDLPNTQQSIRKNRISVMTENWPSFVARDIRWPLIQQIQYPVNFKYYFTTYTNIDEKC